MFRPIATRTLMAGVLAVMTALAAPNVAVAQHPRRARDIGALSGDQPAREAIGPESRQRLGERAL